jgi:uncharacterized protein
MRVSSLFIYPIKSLGGINLKSSLIESRGLQHDRRWMLIDNNNSFLTQRTKPILAKFEVKINADGLVVSNAMNAANVQIPFKPETDILLTSKIWDDVVETQVVSLDVNRWFSEQLGEDIRLVFLPDHSIRPIDNRYSINGQEHTSLSDGYPILMIGQSSLDYLNHRCSEKIEMLKFRPNIAIEDSEPFFEDKIQEVHIGTAQLYGVKPCARCIMTTIDYNKLKFGKEPLLSLSKFRKFENKILFGQNMVVHQSGEIKIGDKLMIF